MKKLLILLTFIPSIATAGEALDTLEALSIARQVCHANVPSSMMLPALLAAQEETGLNNDQLAWKIAPRIVELNEFSREQPLIVMLY